MSCEGVIRGVNSRCTNSKVRNIIVTILYGWGPEDLSEPDNKWKSHMIGWKNVLSLILIFWLYTWNTRSKVESNLPFGWVRICFSRKYSTEYWYSKSLLELKDSPQIKLKARLGVSFHSKNLIFWLLFSYFSCYFLLILLQVVPTFLLMIKNQFSKLLQNGA